MPNMPNPFAANLSGVGAALPVFDNAGYGYNRVFGGGKGNPDMLWPAIEAVLDSEDFALYARTLSDGQEQVIIFDIPGQSWQSSRDLFDIARMKAGSYRGLPHRPYVFAGGTLLLIYFHAKSVLSTKDDNFRTKSNNRLPPFYRILVDTQVRINLRLFNIN